MREPALLDDASRTRLQTALAYSTRLSTVYTMKEKLADIWQRSASTQENLRHAIEDWCHQAEQTGIQALRDFALKLRSYTLVPQPA